MNLVLASLCSLLKMEGPKISKLPGQGWHISLSPLLMLRRQFIRPFEERCILLGEGSGRAELKSFSTPLALELHEHCMSCLVGALLPGLGFLATVIGVFCYSGLVRGFFATVLPGEGFLRQFHGGFLRRCRLAGGFLQQSHGGFLHQFSRPDKATLKQQKLQLENFGFSVFPHIPRRIKKLVLVAVVLLP